MFLGKHNFEAKLEESESGRPCIHVYDKTTKERVEVSFGATSNCSTCYAHVKKVGFIGGWQSRRKSGKFNFFNLVGSINIGNIVSDTNDYLPPRNRCQSF